MQLHLGITIPFFALFLILEWELSISISASTRTHLISIAGSSTINYRTIKCEKIGIRLELIIIVFVAEIS